MATLELPVDLLKLLNQKISGKLPLWCNKKLTINITWKEIPVKEIYFTFTFADYVMLKT